MKAFFVEMKITAVVMADSEQDAISVANRDAREICNDGEMSAEVVVALTHLNQLKDLDDSWDGLCIPYGGDGNTRLKDLLPEDEPVKDTKTIDMFTSKG
jgi:hypothetical protein